MVRIKRNTGILGAGSRIKIYINDKKVATIKQNKQVELELPADEAKVSVSQLGVRSNELIVKEGQVVEIITRSWTYVSLILFFIILASASVFYRCLTVLLSQLY